MRPIFFLIYLFLINFSVNATDCGKDNFSKSELSVLVAKDEIQESIFKYGITTNFNLAPDGIGEYIISNYEHPILRELHHYLNIPIVVINETDMAKRVGVVDSAYFDPPNNRIVITNYQLIELVNSRISKVDIVFHEFFHAYLEQMRKIGRDGLFHAYANAFSAKGLTDILKGNYRQHISFEELGAYAISIKFEGLRLGKILTSESENIKSIVIDRKYQEVLDSLLNIAIMGRNISDGLMEITENNINILKKGDSSKFGIFRKEEILFFWIDFRSTSSNGNKLINFIKELKNENKGGMLYLPIVNSKDLLELKNFPETGNRENDLKGAATFQGAKVLKKLELMKKKSFLVSLFYDTIEDKILNITNKGFVSIDELKTLIEETQMPHDYIIQYAFSDYHTAKLMRSFSLEINRLSLEGKSSDLNFENIAMILGRKDIPGKDRILVTEDLTGKDDLKGLWMDFSKILKNPKRFEEFLAQFEIVFLSETKQLTEEEQKIRFLNFIEKLYLK